MEQKRDDVREAEEVILRSRDEPVSESDGSSNIGMHTAKVMADRIQFHMQPSHPQSIEPSTNGSESLKPKREPTDGACTRKLIAAAVVASCLGSITVWCLGCWCAQSGMVKKKPPVVKKEAVIATLERPSLPSASVQEQLGDMKTAFTHDKQTREDFIEMVRLGLTRIHAKKARGVKQPFELEQQILYLGPRAIPALELILQEKSELSEEAAWMLGRFGVRARLSVKRLAMKEPDLPLEGFYIRAGKNGFNDLQDLLNDRGINQHRAERMLVILAKRYEWVQDRIDSTKTLDSIVDVYWNTKSDDVRKAAITCLRFCNYSTDDALKVATDALNRGIPGADDVLKRLSNVYY